uniref:Uncharacterized protein n=1 Tax=Arundo donax TaxID=35708 RepID=A0A0A9A3A0_ARUDO
MTAAAKHAAWRVRFPLQGCSRGSCRFWSCILKLLSSDLILRKD